MSFEPTKRYSHKRTLLVITQKDIRNARQDKKHRDHGGWWPPLCMSCPFAHAMRRQNGLDSASVFADIIRTTKITRDGKELIEIYDIGPASLDLINEWDKTGKMSPTEVLIKRRVPNAA